MTSICTGKGTVKWNLGWRVVNISFKNYSKRSFYLQTQFALLQSLRRSSNGKSTVTTIQIGIISPGCFDRKAYRLLVYPLIMRIADWKKHICIRISFCEQWMTFGRRTHESSYNICDSGVEMVRYGCSFWWHKSLPQRYKFFDWMCTTPNWADIRIEGTIWLRYEQTRTEMR